MDAAGEVVSVTVTEPRFTPREKALLLASRHDDEAPRGSHGLPLSVATDPANRGRFEVEAVTDFARAKLNRVQDEWRKNYKDVVDLDALLWKVRVQG